MPGEMDAVYLHFARLLDYPASGLSQAAQECATLVAPYSSRAAALVSEFAQFSRAAPPGCLEEAYTYTFDLQAACQPYVGYHLFGDTYQRSLFMLGLRERYRQHGFSADNELPDHLAVILRFLACCPDPAMKSELIQEALLPALQSMMPPRAETTDGDRGMKFDREQDAGQPAAGQRDTGHPDAGQTVYRSLLEALSILLQEGV